VRRIEPGDHIGAGRAGRADANADIASLGARIAVGHMRCAFDVAGKNVADCPARLQSRVKWIDCGSGDTKSAVYPFLFQNATDRRGTFRH